MHSQILLNLSEPPVFAVRYKVIDPMPQCLDFATKLLMLMCVIMMQQYEAPNPDYYTECLDQKPQFAINEGSYVSLAPFFVCSRLQHGRYISVDP